MKPYALLACAALLASPAAFAEDKNLCQINLSEIDQNMTMAMPTIGEPAATKINEYVEKAKEAQKSGDVEECIAQSAKALQLLKGPGSSTTGGAGAGSGSGN